MNILIAAVGGQGALLSSRVIGKLAQNINLDVKISEIHGMSQRGGSVITHVKFGEKVHSPTIEKGSADIILAFEMLEGIRYIDWLKPEGTLIMNNHEIYPMPVIRGVVEYPKNLISKLSKLPIKFYNIDAMKYASKTGNVKVSNMVLIGVLASILNIPEEGWKDAIREIVPEKLLEINLRAFDFGYELE